VALVQLGNLMSVTPGLRHLNIYSGAFICLVLIKHPHADKKRYGWNNPDSRDSWLICYLGSFGHVLVSDDLFLGESHKRRGSNE